VLGRQIGAGGMGVVYEAQSVNRGRKVAVKLIRDALGASPALLCRFTIEAEAVARLDHPNIVHVHEVGECNGHPFFSMDLIAGESLSEKLALGGFPFDWKTAESAPERCRRLEAIARFMAKIARAVQHAHERGVLHRDLKPSNVLIDELGEPHLTDFGLAKILQTAPDEHQPLPTAPGDLPGTAPYMPPEQVSGGEATRAWDIYGLGALLYELLTGRPPFGGHTPLETFKQITEHRPTRLRWVNPAVPANLETICFKCLEKDPRHRYGAAAAVAEDLENWLHGRPIRARPPSRARQVRRWIRRNPIGTALIASLCLGLAVSLTLLKIVRDKQREIEENMWVTFDEGISKISLIWKDRQTTNVTISARDLAVLSDRSPGDVYHAQHQLCFGVSSEAAPSSVAQGYARLLGPVQHAMEIELGETVAFSLKLFKQFNRDEESLARGDADFMVLSAVDYLRAEDRAPGVTPIARGSTIREGVIFAHTNAGVQGLTQLSGKSIAFPDPDLSITVWAKARLAAAGVQAANLRAWTNLVDEGVDMGEKNPSPVRTADLVLAREVDAGVTYRDRFERNKYRGLKELDHFIETPNVLAARPGVDPRIVEALRHAVRVLEGKAGFDSLALDLPGEMVSVDESYFVPLREALRQAERFERTVATKR
jgi:serine/threonine protein kinase